MQSNQSNTNTKNDLEFYDVIINIESLLGFKHNYEIQYSEKGFEQYQKKKEDKCCTVGVVGNKNKGKTFLLEKLSKIELPKGYTVTTRGVSVVYPKTMETIAGTVLIDTAGLETPLLKNSTIAQDMSLISRDKQLTELFLQRFVIKHSNVLIAVVGALTLSDQKLLHRITNDWKKGKTSKLFVLHNLMHYETMTEVKEYIKDILLQSFTFDLEETQSINMQAQSNSTKENNQSGIMTIYQQFVKNKHNETQPIIHLIMAREGSEAGNQLNDKIVDYLQKQIDTNANNDKFPIVEEMKQYLSTMSKDLFEEPKIEVTDIEITDDKIIKLKNPKDIVLKRCMVNELGESNLYSNTFSPKCLCYIDGNKLIFELEIAEKVKNLTCNVYQHNECNNFCIKGEKLNENAKFLEGKEILYQSIESGVFTFDFSIPNEKLQLSSTTCAVSRKTNSPTNNILMTFTLQEKTKEQSFDL